ncbi:hypothetical protein S4A8_03223 [Salinisphaera sp. S4-8]|uniref:hypothetical protein n=1 Tax=Salinisphaera sp. S4-8 TaxID=633357 RepID=UPI003341212B
MTLRKQRQPLNYQTQNNSCWPTTVINGLTCVLDDKQLVPLFAVRLLHAALEEEGIGGGGHKRPADWRIAMDGIETRCGVKARHVPDRQANRPPQSVEAALECIDFSKSVVVADVGAGSHSLLLVDRQEHHYYGFDPLWSTIIDGAKRHDYETFPDACLGENQSKVDRRLRGRVNFAVDAAHLFAPAARPGWPYAMGAAARRHITVLETL